MKVVAIIGSPKGKGAGYSIVKMIEAAMNNLGTVEFDYIFLKDANLKLCMGCYSCLAIGENTCPLDDDRGAIQKRIFAADGVILSSPVHVSNVSALMKNFIDRFAYMNHRPQFHSQKVLNVVNMAGNDKKTALLALRFAIGGARGARPVHELAVITPPWRQTESAVAAKQRKIYATSKSFYQACLNPSLPSPTLQGCIDFLLMKTLYLDLRECLPADYEFYRRRDYYFHTKINSIKAVTAKLIVGTMMGVWKRMGWGPGTVSWPLNYRED